MTNEEYEAMIRFMWTIDPFQGWTIPVVLAWNSTPECVPIVWFLRN